MRGYEEVSARKVAMELLTTNQEAAEGATTKFNLDASEVGLPVAELRVPNSGVDNRRSEDQLAAGGKVILRGGAEVAVARTLLSTGVPKQGAHKDFGSREESQSTSSPSSR